MKLQQLHPLFPTFLSLPLFRLSALGPSPAQALEFHSPENEQILIAGTKFDIEWAPYGGQTGKRTANLTLMHMLSASSIGGSYLQIATNVPVDSGKYSWIVPIAAGLDINNVHFPPWAVMARWIEGEGEEAKEEEQALSAAFWVNEVQFWERDGVVMTAADGGLDKTLFDDGGSASTTAADSSTSKSSTSAPGTTTAASTTAENSGSSGSGSSSTEKEAGVSPTPTISSTERGASTTTSSIESSTTTGSSTLSINPSSSASSVSSVSSSSSSPPSSSPSSSAPAPAPAAPSTKKNEIPMIIGTSVGILSLLILIGSFLFFRRKHKQKHAPSAPYPPSKHFPVSLTSRRTHSNEKDAVELQAFANAQEMEGMSVRKYEMDGSTIAASFEELPRELDSRCVTRGHGVGIAGRGKEMYEEDRGMGRVKVLRVREEKSLRIMKGELAVGLPGGERG